MGSRKAYLVTDILSGPYCTFFIIPGGCKLGTMIQVCYHMASTPVQINQSVQSTNRPEGGARGGFAIVQALGKYFEFDVQGW